jgi:hypothetical protein
MSDVVYAIRGSYLEYSRLKIIDIKIGRSTNIENTLRQYSRGNRSTSQYSTLVTLLSYSSNSSGSL